MFSFYFTGNAKDLIDIMLAQFKSYLQIILLMIGLIKFVAQIKPI